MPEAVLANVETLKAIKAKADGLGQRDLAKSIEVHIQHLEGQRKALQWSNVAISMSSNQRRPPGVEGRSGEERSFDELSEELMGFDTDVPFVGNQHNMRAFEGHAVREENIFESEKNIAKHFRNRTLSDNPGQSPTSYAYGGHAKEGVFSDITGRSYTQIAKNVLLRVDELVNAGILVRIGRGASNAAYLHVPTQQVVRVGRISSADLAATVGFSKIGNEGVGAKIDLAKSLYIPNELLPNFRSKAGSSAKTEGLAVVVMERVPGMQLHGNGDQLTPAAKQKIPPAAADALVSMHMNNKTHGDFGAHNVNVTDDGEVRIIDFDLSSNLRIVESSFVRDSRSEFAFTKDLDGLGDILEAIYPPVRQSLKQRQANWVDVYVQAVDRAVGPSRNADVYARYPELFDSDVNRFNARKEVLKRAALNAFQ